VAQEIGVHRNTLNRTIRKLDIKVGRNWQKRA
jgi:DNA-binding PucR family transcriptional regulator